MSNWKKVFSSSQLAVASMVSGILMEQKIQTNVLNKIDSSYVFLGLFRTKYKMVMPIPLLMKCISMGSQIVFV